MTPDLDEITWVAERRPDVDEPDGVATERARMALMRDMSAEQTRPRRRWVPWLAATASGAAVAAAGVAVLTAGGGNTVTTVQSTVAPRTASVTTTASPAPAHHVASPVVAGSPVLLHLAHAVAHAPALPGNATLVIHHNSVHGPDANDFSGDDLYEDNGDYYYGGDLSQLRQAVADPASADTSEGKMIAAAASSADATPAQAAQAIYEVSPAPSDPNTIAASRRTMITKLRAMLAAPSTVAARAKLQQELTQVENAPDTVTQAQRDNILWSNIGIALEGGEGRSDVRAGALLAASQLPQVTVTSTTFDGQPVLQVTNGQFPDGYAETYDLDPQTGVLVHFHGGSPAGGDGVDVTYEVSRVTTPDLQPAH
jgi:hypothetical protein